MFYSRSSSCMMQEFPFYNNYYYFLGIMVSGLSNELRGESKPRTPSQEHVTMQARPLLVGQIEIIRNKTISVKSHSFVGNSKNLAQELLEVGMKRKKITFQIGKLQYFHKMISSFFRVARNLNTPTKSIIEALVNIWVEAIGRWTTSTVQSSDSYFLWCPDCFLLAWRHRNREWSPCHRLA